MAEQVTSCFTFFLSELADLIEKKIILIELLELKNIHADFWGLLTF